MGAHKIEVFEGNTIEVTCTVTGISSLDGFTAKLTVKTDKDATSALFEVDGTITGMDIKFTPTATQNSLVAGMRYYEVTIEKDSEKYTIRQDEYVILKSMIYVSSN